MNWFLLPADRQDKAARKPHRQLLRLALWLGLALVLLLVALGLAYLSLQIPYSDLISLEQSAWRFRYIGISLQLMVLAVAVWRWPGLVAWAVRCGLIRPREQAAALAVRYKAALLALIFIVAAEIGPGDFVRLIRAFTG